MRHSQINLDANLVPQSSPGMVESIELRDGGLSMAPCPEQDATRPSRTTVDKAMVVGDIDIILFMRSGCRCEQVKDSVLF